jgi:hypothetical protein
MIPGTFLGFEDRTCLKEMQDSLERDVVLKNGSNKRATIARVIFYPYFDIPKIYNNSSMHMKATDCFGLFPLLDLRKPGMDRASGTSSYP